MMARMTRLGKRLFISFDLEALDRYACLTHVGIKTHRTKGQTEHSNHVLRLPSIQQPMAQMRQMIWQEEIQNVVKHTHDKSVLARLTKLLSMAA